MCFLDVEGTDPRPPSPLSGPHPRKSFGVSAVLHGTALMRTREGRTILPPLASVNGDDLSPMALLLATLGD